MNAITCSTDADSRSGYAARSSGSSGTICSFYEFIRTVYHEKCRKFVSVHFSAGTLPFTGNPRFYYTSTSLSDVEIQKVSVNRKDLNSMYTDIVVCASFTDKKTNIYRFRYRIRGFLQRSGESVLLKDIYLYRTKDIPDENTVSCYLVPYLSKKELDAEAELILKLYYPEALESPVSVDARKLAENMGFRVLKARLSKDNSKPGDIFFRDTETILYREGHPFSHKVPANTILIDTEALKHRRYNADDIIIHECVHACEHYFFFLFCSVQNCSISPEELSKQFPEDSPLRWIENQADHITPRIRMPITQAAVKAAEIYENIKDDPDSYEKLVSELREFYSVSEITVRNRLALLGYKKTEHSAVKLQ